MKEGIYLTAHRTLLRAALSFAHVFAWIFVFEYLYLVLHSWETALVHTVYAYALTHITTILTTPYGGRFLGNSVKRTMCYGVIANSLAFLVLGTVFQGSWGTLTGLGIALFAILFGLYRALYWAPYVVEHRFAGEQPRYLERELLIALLPALAGILLARGNIIPGQLLFIGSAVLLISLIPLLNITERYEKFSWGYVETFTRLLSRKNHRILIEGILLGIENTALLLLWPIALLLIVAGSNALFGIVLTITMLMALLLRIPQASFYLTHTHTTDGGHYIDEYTTLREMSESFGRILICSIVVFVASTSTFVGALLIGFVIAAFAGVVRGFAKS